MVVQRVLVVTSLKRVLIFACRMFVTVYALRYQTQADILHVNMVLCYLIQSLVHFDMAVPL